MILSLIGHNYRYELEKLVRIFLPFEKITFTDTEESSDNSAVTVAERRDGDTMLKASLNLCGKYSEYRDTVENLCDNYEKECERVLAVQLYRCFTEITGYFPEWGILTGVRPAKLFSRLSSVGGSEYASSYFKNSLYVSENKINLCKKAVLGEEKIISLSKPESFSLYISIPFCPSRCSYCSFVSHSVDRAKSIIPEYVNLLCREIEITAEISKKLNLRLETVYIGGGTPTTLTAEQLSRIMKTVSANFDVSTVREYTVEAGRPDTITVEKLNVIKENGATRISINPQTMNDAVLAEIGRRHSAEDTEKVFLLARKCGHNNINMDLIAGLPKDDLDSFKDTLKRVLNLNPEAVTVHSLSVKRAAGMSKNGQLPDFETGKTAAEMVKYAEKELENHDIFPYYMYRQSKTVGNLENVGYSKSGFEGLYNVYIMDETHTIFACGASAVTKLRQPDGDFISRIFNFKYPYEYISRFDEIIKRKAGVSEFYEKYSFRNK